MARSTQGRMAFSKMAATDCAVCLRDCQEQGFRLSEAAEKVALSQSWPKRAVLAKSMRTSYASRLSGCRLRLR